MLHNPTVWQFQVDRCWCGHMRDDHVKRTMGDTTQCFGCVNNGYAAPNAFHAFSATKPSDIELYAGFVHWTDFASGWQDRLITARMSWEDDSHWLQVLTTEVALRSRSGSEPEPQLGGNILPAPAERPDPVAVVNVDPTELPPGRRPFVMPELDEPVAAPGERPVVDDNDPTAVYVVTEGSYSSYQILGVFVGDKAAAQAYVDTRNRLGNSRWNAADIEVYEDLARVTACRQFAPYVRYAYRTTIDTNTAAVYNTHASADVETDIHPEVGTTGTIGKRWTEIVTSGPESALERVRKSHSEHVAKVRTAILDDPALLDHWEEHGFAGSASSDG